MKLFTGNRRNNIRAVSQHIKHISLIVLPKVHDEDILLYFTQLHYYHLNVKAKVTWVLDNFQSYLHIMWVT